MLRLIALLAVAAGIAMLFGPRRLRWIFAAIAGLAMKTYSAKPADVEKKWI
jgi:Sec-independent protein translocase protein TatA